MGVDPLNPQSFNRYAYANNNPYRYVDPDGRAPIVGPIIVGFALELGNLALEAYDNAANPCGDCARSSGVSLPGSGALGGAVGKTLAKAADNLSSTAGAARGIATPHGLAVQADGAAARAALEQVRSGATVYRQGSFGVQNSTDAQFWSMQNPATTESFASKMGMPGGTVKPDWLMGGTVRPGSPVITRPAPGIGSNSGGDIEAVVPPGGVQNLWFHMPD